MHAQAGAAAAVHHVDRGHLADRLQEDAVELRQELRHQLRALGRRGDRVAEEVAAAGQERADGGRVGALDDERLDLRQGTASSGRSTGSGACGRPGAEQLRRVLAARSLARGIGAEAVGLRAGVDAQAAAVAVLQVEDDRDQAGLGIDLGSGGDAVLGAGVDAAAAALAVLGSRNGLGRSWWSSAILSRVENPTWPSMSTGWHLKQ